MNEEMKMSKALAICDRVYAVGGSGLSAPEDAFVYPVNAESELVMIDAGVGYGIGRIEDKIRSLGFDPARIGHIIATHCHIDHIGGLSLWKERYGCKVIAHELDRAGIEPTFRTFIPSRNNFCIPSPAGQEL